MLTEADTCRKFVVPKLQAAGWDNEPHSIAEQRTITDGRIVPVGKGFVRQPSKKVDYLLRHTRDFPLAVVEAKVVYKNADDAVQQARQYAEMLGLKFAYATNGHEIIECDYFAGTEVKRPDFPSPSELWARYRSGNKITSADVADRLLTPSNHDVGKGERYYQQIAINRTIEAILSDDRRLLLTMATGTGKTAVAFQICWKLWNARWNRTGEYRRPRILYLADRNILIDQPKDGIFAAFGDARFKIESGEVVKSREMYFAIYQALAEDERRVGLFNAFPPDFFDLVIVDECHRGSARDDSSWRAILNHFEPAYQLGMTATPLRDDNRDTYLYFGNPLYEYSLRQGIDDGFLAPYRVHRVITDWDAVGWRPNKNELDRFGRPIPDDEYQTKDFERVVALRARSLAIANHLTRFMRRTDSFAKTIVFCVDQEHASDMRAALVELNPDLVAKNPDYVCRVTADEGDIGRGHLSRFQDVDTRTPTILTTSQLLTTGVDAPTCKDWLQDATATTGRCCRRRQSLLRLRRARAQLREFRDDVAVEADLPRDAAKSLDRLSKWSRIQLLEVRDSETPHLPLAFGIANVAPDSKHANVGLEQAGGNVRCDISRRLAVVDDVPILNVNGNDLLLTAHHDRDAVKLSLFVEGPVPLVQLFRVAGKCQENRALLFAQFSGRVVVSKHEVQRGKRSTSLWIPVADASSVNPASNLRACLVFDRVHEPRTTGRELDEVHVLLLTQQRRQLGHVFGQPAHRQRVRRIRVDDKLEQFAPGRHNP